MIDWKLVSDIAVSLSALVTICLTVTVVALLLFAGNDLLMARHVRRFSQNMRHAMKQAEALAAQRVASLQQSARQLLFISACLPIFIVVCSVPWILRAMGCL